MITDKIFQPFFTPIPTCLPAGTVAIETTGQAGPTGSSGRSTGLGLSLSYDIVKAHGGEIKIQTNENEATTFTIVLPV